MQAQKALKTGYFGADGGIAPLWSCGAQALAPSFLTGDGSHMALWVSIAIHVVALTLNLVAGIAFFVNSGDGSGDLLKGWAVCSMVFHGLGVLGTVATTAVERDVWSKPLQNTLGIGLFLAGLFATLKVSFTHGGWAAMPAHSVENVNFNLSLLFQCLGLASLIANSLTALANKGGL